MLQDITEKIRIVQQNRKAAQDRQKSYADHRSKPLEFEKEDKVFRKFHQLRKYDVSMAKEKPSFCWAI